jgi:hypothetical protein
MEPSLQLIQTLVERVLEGQRRADAKLDRMIDDIQDLKVRMTSSEEATAGTNRRLDRLEMRLDRIERRLDLVTS